jgi:hypothetical protein
MFHYFKYGHDREQNRAVLVDDPDPRDVIVDCRWNGQDL